MVDMFVVFEDDGGKSSDVGRKIKVSRLALFVFSHSRLRIPPYKYPYPRKKTFLNKG